MSERQYYSWYLEKKKEVESLNTQVDLWKLTVKEQKNLIKELEATVSDMYVALNCMIAGAAAVACPNAGERQVLQEAVDIAQKALKKAKGESQ